MDNGPARWPRERLQGLRDAGVSVAPPRVTVFGRVWRPVEPARPASDPTRQWNRVLSSVLAVASIENGTAYAAFTAADRDVAYQRARGFESVADLSDYLSE